MHQIPTEQESASSEKSQEPPPVSLRGSEGNPTTPVEHFSEETEPLENATGSSSTPPKSPPVSPGAHAGNSSATRPVSAAKILAGRKNAQKSPGPTTPEGKSRSRRNAKKHGILSSEISSPEFHELLSELRKHFTPFDIMEDYLVQQIAACIWHQKMNLRATAGQVDKDSATAATELFYNSPDALTAWSEMRLGRERTMEEYEECSEPLTSAEANIVETMRENLTGVEVLRVYMEVIRSCVKSTGIVSPYLENLLRCCCGSAAESMPTLLKRDIATQQERVAKFLERLDAEDQFLEERGRLLAAKAKVDLRWVSIPHLRVDQIVRYGAHNSRELYRALAELERCQRKRAGEAVDPLIRVDVV
jgi:hypothetical protein